jgi:hypothetical protein
MHWYSGHAPAATANPVAVHTKNNRWRFQQENSAVRHPQCIIRSASSLTTGRCGRFLTAPAPGNYSA